MVIKPLSNRRFALGRFEKPMNCNETELTRSETSLASSLNLPYQCQCDNKLIKGSAGLLCLRNRPQKLRQFNVVKKAHFHSLQCALLCRPWLQACTRNRHLVLSATSLCWTEPCLGQLESPVKGKTVT